MTQLNFNTSLLQAGALSVSQTGAILRVEIAREKSLNALIPSTFIALHHILDLTTSNPPFHILLRGRGRAFSAGGDVRAIRTKCKAAGQFGSAERRKAARDTLKTEYDLLERWAGVAGSGVTTVAVGNGLAFGAGAGLFQACEVKLVTAKFLMAMPEVRIGLIPDCGATRFYARMPGCTGMYAGLTAKRIGAEDAVRLGLADGGVQDGWWGEGVEEGGGVSAALNCVQEGVLGVRTAFGDDSSEMRRMIDECFSRGSFEEVVEAVERCRGCGDGWVEEALEVLNGASPRALRETFAAMKEAYKARDESLGNALNRELDVDARLGAEWDFEEGVRAVLVDKDNQPRWSKLE
eukprot:GFKZ01000606.1.p1 GENE.GFKZ01000606.1~~GFKZ01000606.1.p1  ORF type:complete len:350 (-),score=56.56 GFKZ01000606.1:164-1213(-)